MLSTWNPTDPSCFLNIWRCFRRQRRHFVDEEIWVTVDTHRHCVRCVARLECKFVVQSGVFVCLYAFICSCIHLIRITDGVLPWFCDYSAACIRVSAGVEFISERRVIPWSFATMDEEPHITLPLRAPNMLQTALSAMKGLYAWDISSGHCSN
jgi:hypothetical protein